MAPIARDPILAIGAYAKATKAPPSCARPGLFPSRKSLTFTSGTPIPNRLLRKGTQPGISSGVSHGFASTGEGVIAVYAILAATLWLPGVER